MRGYGDTGGRTPSRRITPRGSSNIFPLYFSSHILVFLFTFFGISLHNFGMTLTWPKNILSVIFKTKDDIFLKLIFLHIKLSLVMLYNRYQLFIFIHVVLHWWFCQKTTEWLWWAGLARYQLFTFKHNVLRWWFLAEENRMIVVGGPCKNYSYSYLYFI